jgi:hypothetical protein
MIQNTYSNSQLVKIYINNTPIIYNIYYSIILFISQRPRIPSFLSPLDMHAAPAAVPPVNAQGGGGTDVEHRSGDGMERRVWLSTSRMFEAALLSQTPAIPYDRIPYLAITVYRRGFNLLTRV